MQILSAEAETAAFVFRSPISMMKMISGPWSKFFGKADRDRFRSVPITRNDVCIRQLGIERSKFSQIAHWKRRQTMAGLILLAAVTALYAG